MLDRRQEFNIQLQQLLDCLLLLTAFWLSHSLRWNAPQWIEGLHTIRPFPEFVWMAVIIVPLTPIILEINGYYRNPLERTVAQTLRAFLQVLLWTGFIVGACVFFLKWVADSRAVILLFLGLAPTFLLIKEYLLRQYLRRQLRKGKIQTRVVLAGGEAEMEVLWHRLPDVEKNRMEVVDRIDISRRPISDFPAIFRHHNVERVLFAAERMHLDQVELAVQACEIEGVEAWVSTRFLNAQMARPTFDTLGDNAMLVFRTTSANYWALLAKDVMDRALGALILLLTLPLWIFAYLGIKISSPGPAIFRQERGGRYGKPFRMYKFRTMCLDAEDRREELEAHNELDGPAFKMKQDPRIFRFGSFLRHSSIDELPQLINVIRGEMSLVGPRPLPIYEVKRIQESSQRRRLSMKPGLTCLWQVSGRNGITDFREWVRLDLSYIDNWSLWLDLKILLRTIPTVLRGAGAR